VRNCAQGGDDNRVCDALTVADFLDRGGGTGLLTDGP